MPLTRLSLIACLLLTAGHLRGGEAAEAVRAWLVATYATGAKEAVTAKVAGTVYANATLVAAQESSVQLYAKDLDGALPWTLLGDDGICLLAESLVAKASVPVRESWLMLAIACKRSETPAFRRVRDELFRADAAAAGRVNAALGVGAAPKADPPIADAGAAPADPSFPSVDGETAIIPTGAEDDESAPMIDKSGKVIRSAYLRWAYDYSATMVSKRLGPTKAQLKTGAKPKNANKAEVTEATSSARAKIWSPPMQFFKGARNGQGMPWNVGGPPTADAGDYSGTHAQILYAPDAANDPGVDRILILEEGHNCFTYQPTPTWWGGSHPEPTLGTPSWREASPKGLGAPVAIARGYGTWCNSGIIAFSSGLLGTAGTCTSQNAGTFLKLPPGKVPTAIALTSRNEFALVTVWDVVKLKGELAVVALECCHTEGLMAIYCWHQKNPGLPSVGGFTSMKLLGFVDLPFATPTAISATGNRIGTAGWLSVDGRNGFPREIDLSKQSFRDSFGTSTGANATYAQSSGYAVIASRYENKVAFVDLQPLFQHFGEMYFTTDKRYQRTREYGPDPKQWPCDFSVDDAPRPVVVKCVKVIAPSAVNVTIGGDSQSRAYIATESGALQIWRVGGLATDAPASSSEIAMAGQVAIGRNPTCLAYVKDLGWGKPDTLRNQIIAVCRGDQELSWIQLAGDTGTVIRRLRDTRLEDPVHAEVADTHGTESSVVTVTDFLGKQVVNYRFGPVVFHTNGGLRVDMGPDGKAEFECGGAMPFPGCPYMVCGTNVN
ncbi:MAG: hypothetical protein H0W72_12520 [Planctomycetes bacterium]|nr:hypothetical protein [Planctomycetota bacterium]